MRRRPGPLLAAALLTYATVGCGQGSSDEPLAVLTGTSIVEEDAGVPVLGVEVIETVPHRSSAYTQGLVWDGDRLYEGTGQVGSSALAELDPATGQALRSTFVDPAVFGEGLALVDDELVQITWKDGIAFRYDAATFESTGRHEYAGEGWGLCFDGERLVMSDGSSTLTFRDPATFEELGDVRVTLDGDGVEELNELECVGDRVYANVWHTDTIVEIDPDSGDVTAVVDATVLLGELEPRPTHGEAVLNGIAHDPDTDTFWLTGKLWPQMFQVRFVAAE
jgi:glutaminyl-peptide cyclotransferase